MSVTQRRKKELQVLVDEVIRELKLEKLIREGKSKAIITLLPWKDNDPPKPKVLEERGHLPISYAGPAMLIKLKHETRIRVKDDPRCHGK